MSSGREFHTAGPDTRKLLGPKRRVLVRGVARCPRAAERRWARAPITEMGMQDRLRYIGPRPWSEFRSLLFSLSGMQITFYWNSVTNLCLSGCHLPHRIPRGPSNQSQFPHSKPAKPQSFAPKIFPLFFVTYLFNFTESRCFLGEIRHITA